MCRFLFLFFFTSLFSLSVSAQQTAIIYGTIKDSTNKPLSAVSIAVLGIPGGISSDNDGKYSLVVPANKAITLVFSFIGFKTEKVNLKLAPDEKRELSFLLKAVNTRLPDLTIEHERNRHTNLIPIDPKIIQFIPSPSDNFESILKTLPGVTSNNELSSQYNVRGGNYDENLVYVNDIEIYRPFLIRSGQQEGLSFINSDLVSSILFSAGGFEARYGDKMSSVLDIQYKKPKEFAGSASLSLLGGGAHVEGSSKNQKWAYLLGFRQKSNQYLLNSLETRGDYKPSFTDIQYYISYEINDKLEISHLGNYSYNKYLLLPEDRETTFGTLNEALQLRIYFDGREVDTYETFMGALSSTYRPNANLKLKFITSSFKTYESEAFDILGQYFLNELEKDFSKDNFGDILFNIGVGSFLSHARNDLEASVYSAEHKGYYTKRNHNIQWGAKYQLESITDKLNEWKMVDSADYSLPQSPDSIILLQEVISTKNELSSQRYSGYMQDTWLLNDQTSLTGGIRANYWDLNQQFLVSPRISYSYKPIWKHDIVFRASAGFYYQPPFYRELRDLGGNLNKDIKAQQSIHFVIGGDYNLRIWGRPFKYVSEIYYKHLENLIPYEIDNVRIRYYATNNARGYATGIDMRINGEFVSGVESWASLSVMQTQEDIKDDFYYKYYDGDGNEISPALINIADVTDSIRIEPGYIPRPTDQRLTFSLLFQDYLPKNPTYKMHLNLVFGTSLPFGPPGYERYKDTLRIPPYRRVDIGFSKQIIGENPKNPINSRFLNYFNSVWVSLEVFNLLQVNNTISYLWVTDVTNRQYAVPNYLTSRQLNFRMIVKF